MNQDIHYSLIQEAKIKRRRYIVFSLIPFIIGLIWVIVTIAAVGSSRRQLDKLNYQKDTLQGKIKEYKSKISELEKSFNTTKGLLISIDTMHGTRKEAVLLAYDLQARKISFKFGGRQPKDGLDHSGFIDYILSQPQFDIVKNPLYCNQSCLKSNSSIVEVFTLSELKPGDLLFYGNEITMMYLGNNQCIGMLIMANTIVIKDANFLPIKQYGKVQYPPNQLKNNLVFKKS